VRTEVDGGGDPDRGTDGGTDGDRGGDQDGGADGGGDNDGGGDPYGGGDLDGDASVEGGRRDVGPVDRTGLGHGATSAQARRRLLRLASSCGDESRENEIEFYMREEREREREIRREERFILLSRESRDRNLWLWWDQDFGLRASHLDFWPPALCVPIVLGLCFFLYRLIKSADIKNEFLLLVSPTVISVYQK
jgi:hypothetical protein